MEFALNKLPMEGYTCLLDTVVCQEETQESIVPDACPDIGAILTAQGRAQLARKECLDGKVEGSGNVRVTVLYLPDGETGVRSLEVCIPFRTSVPAAGLEAGCPAVVVPRVAAVEARVLNPRKVLCRVELAVLCQGWRPGEACLCAPWEGGGLQQKTVEVERYADMAVAEKPFAFTDEVTLTPSHPGAAELLGHRLDLGCSEAKIIGNKLIFKGEAVLRVRYRTEDGALAMGRWDLPFSQILEVNGVEEESSCTVEVVEKESQVSLTGDPEGRTLSVHLELLAQAVVRQTRQVAVFTDAYSVNQKVTVRREERPFTQLWEENSVVETAREVLETQTAPGRVEECCVTLGQTQVLREEEGALLTVQGRICALYTGEDGVLSAVTRPVTVSARVALPPHGMCDAHCALGGEIQAAIAGGGIEVRCPVRFSYRATVERRCAGVVTLEAEELETAEELPSVRLRLAQPGESLWDIAKACLTTETAILSANDLPDPECPEGSLLLIPKCR